MNRSNYPVSVVPYPIDRTAPAISKELDENADWDSKWLRPNLTPPSVTAPSVTIPSSAVPNVTVIEKPKVSAAPMVTETKDEEPEEEERPGFHVRLLRWLFPDVNERRAARFPTPGLVAYYWTGGAPHSYHVGDMSATGLFLLTHERWAPGTLIQMTLQQQDGSHSAANSICVLSEVVRWGENGSGFNFVLTDYENVLDYGIMPGEATNRKTVETFLRRIGAPIGR
jgi:hypothetical protein